LKGAYFYGVEATAPWTVEAPVATELAPRVMPDSEHLIPYHVLVRGRCHATLVSGRSVVDSVAMESGDVVVFPHGDSHVMSSAPGLRPPAGDQMKSAPPPFPVLVQLRGDGDEQAQFVCGFLGCDLRPFNPLLATLPRMIHMRGTPDGALARFSAQAAEEAVARRSGGALVLTRLSELMFIEVVRRHVDSLPDDRSGWLAGLRDPSVGRALALLHAEPARAWTLPELANEAAVSRSVLAERFASFVGQPPMQYLAQWRMQLAANLLAETNAKVSDVALRVGYDSEAAFSRAFKKSVGVPPAEWRRKRSPVPV
jgi:AraC-like DNA-binding protein